MLISIKLLLAIDAFLLAKLSLVRVNLLKLGELLFLKLNSPGLVFDEPLLLCFDVLLLLCIFGL